MSGPPVALDTVAARELAAQLERAADGLAEAAASIAADGRHGQLEATVRPTEILVRETSDELSMGAALLRATAEATERSDLLRPVVWASTVGPAAARLLMSIVDATGHRPLDLPDPAPVVELPTAHVGFLPLWTADGPRAADAIQGAVGDCWLIAALGALAHVDPDRITDRIDEHGDGSFTVHFGTREDGWHVRVDDEAHFGKRAGVNELLHAGRFVAEGRALWPVVVEKAWAVREGSYGELAGDDASTAWKAFGGDTELVSLNPRFARDPSDTSIADTIEQRLDGGYPVTATATGVFGMRSVHAWVVTALDRDDDTAYVTLRNPWGTAGVSVDDDGALRDVDGIVRTLAGDDHAERIEVDLADDASVRMPIDVFTANFREIEFVTSWRD